MSLHNFKAEKYEIFDLQIIFSNIGVQYMNHTEATALAMELDICEFWKPLADKLTFGNKTIQWIDSLQKGQTGSSFLKLLEFCEKENITIGTLLRCLQELNYVSSLHILKSMLKEIMNRYLSNIDCSMLNPKRESDIRILIQSTSCRNIVKSLRTIICSLNINGFTPCTVLDNLPKERVDKWIKTVDYIVVVISTSYKTIMEKKGNCDECENTVHDTSMHTHEYICHNILASNKCILVNNNNLDQAIGCISTSYHINEIESSVESNISYDLKEQHSSSIMSSVNSCDEISNNDNSILKNEDPSHDTNLEIYNSSNRSDYKKENKNSNKKSLKNFVNKLSIKKPKFTNEGNKCLQQTHKRSLQVVNLLLKDCDCTNIPVEFSKLPTFNWFAQYNDLFIYLNSN